MKRLVNFIHTASETSLLFTVISIVGAASVATALIGYLFTMHPFLGNVFMAAIMVFLILHGAWPWIKDEYVSLKKIWKETK